MQGHIKSDAEGSSLLTKEKFKINSSLESIKAESIVSCFWTVKLALCLITLHGFGFTEPTVNRPCNGQIVLIFWDSKIVWWGLSLMYCVIKLELNLNQSVIRFNKPTNTDSTAAPTPHSHAYTKQDLHVCLSYTNEEDTMALSVQSWQVAVMKQDSGEQFPVMSVWRSSSGMMSVIIS